MNFILSFGLIIICALCLGTIFKKIKLPSLIGYLITGIILGPYVFNLINNDILSISSSLRQFALIVILTRAGLSLNINDLKKVGRPAIMLCFVPACLEIIGYLLLGHFILGLSIFESCLLGSVMAAVSPAVVVPRMIKLQEEGYGTNKNIPQMIITGASCDDVFVIVLFSSFLTMVSNGNFDYSIFYQVPVSIILGIGIGLLFGLILSLLFKKININNTIKILILLSFTFIFVGLETLIKNYVPYSGLLSVISLGIMLKIKDNDDSVNLNKSYNKIWIFAEIILFCLVGAEVDIKFAFSQGLIVILVLFIALIFRIIGVFICLIKTKLNFKERLFCAISYLPKATVQASIGGIALSMGLDCGKIILTFAVLAILITAPLGAFLTDFTYKKLLTKENID